MKCVSQFLNTFSRIRADHLGIPFTIFLLGIHLKGVMISKCLLFVSSPKWKVACFQLSMTNQGMTPTQKIASSTCNVKHNDKSKSMTEASFCFFFSLLKIKKHFAKLSVSNFFQSLRYANQIKHTRKLSGLGTGHFLPTSLRNKSSRT